MEAIILAGGAGTRLRSVVSDVPKVMASVAGRPFLEFILDYWIGQGINHFILATGFKHDVIEQHFGQRYKTANLTYSRELHPLGTGGGLLLAIEKLSGSEPFLLLNGDTFLELTLSDVKVFHSKKSANGVIALVKVDQNTRYAHVEIDNNARISAFNMSAQAGGGPCFVNGGVYLFNRKMLADMNEEPGRKLSLEEDLFPKMLACGKKLFGFASAGRFIDIGIPADYQKAQTMFSPKK